MFCYCMALGLRVSFIAHGTARDVHSFPTRRSSDLTVTGPLGGAPRRRAAPMVASKAAADGLVSGTATGPLSPGGPRPPGSPLGPAAVGASVVANPYAGVGRNDPCPCGSGKKFKKCHGAAV